MNAAVMNQEIKPAIKAPHSFFIGGQWQKPAESGKLSVISPVTEEVVLTFAEATPPTSTAPWRPRGKRSIVGRGRACRRRSAARRC